MPSPAGHWQVILGGGWVPNPSDAGILNLHRAVFQTPIQKLPAIFFTADINERAAR